MSYQDIYCMDFYEKQNVFPHNEIYCYKIGIYLYHTTIIAASRYIFVGISNLSCLYFFQNSFAYKTTIFNYFAQS